MATIKKLPLNLIYQHVHEAIFIPLKLELPPEWQVTFEWTRDKDAYGWTQPLSDDDDGFPEYSIEISSIRNTTYFDLMESMIHECLHVHLAYTKYAKWHEHGNRFEKLRKKIQAFTGFEVE